MQISNENGRLKGSYTPKDLAWMRGIEVPALAVAIAMKEADDSAEKFGETMRFANSADKKAFRKFMRIKGVPMREEIIAAWEHHCTEEAN